MRYNYRLEGNKLSIYDIENRVYMSTFLQNEDVDFFKKLFIKLNNKLVTKECYSNTWTYKDGILEYSASFANEEFGICINDHEFIKIICENIVKIN